MDGAEDQMPRFGGHQRHLEGFGVAHFADQDHVRVLAHDVAQPVGEVRHVNAHLALVDDRLGVRVQVFDRVLDGDDVERLGLVDDLDQRRQRGGLARAGDAGDQHQPAVESDGDLHAAGAG